MFKTSFRLGICASYSMTTVISAPEEFVIIAEYTSYGKKKMKTSNIQTLRR
jgi:hypothetical protein